MSGNARFHDKLHRSNHHTLSTSGLLDSAYDPIASPDYPFQGDFILNGNLSASGSLSARDLNIGGEITINGNTTTQNQTIIGSLRLAKPSYGGTAIYAQNAATNPNNYTLSINYENGVFVSNDLTVYGTITGKLPSIDGITLNTRDISIAYVTLSSNSGYWNEGYYASTWVKSNSSTMYVDRLGVNTDISLLPSNLKLAVNGDTVIYGNLSSLGSTTLVNVTANVTDALSVVNLGFSSPNAIYISQGGPGAGIKMNNSGSGPMMTLEGNGNVGIGTGTPNEKLTVSGNISATGVLYASGGNSNQWNNVVANVSNNSGYWQDAYSTVNANSATTWSYQGTDLKALSSNWQNTYTTVNSNSTTTWSYQGNDLKALSSNWQSTYSTVSANSASWDSSYVTLLTNSANWDIATTYGDTDLIVRSLSSRWETNFNIVTANSANWQNTYSTVSSNSANWSYQGNDLKALSSNWQNTYSTVSANSASWSSVTTSVKFKSYSETSVSVAIPGTFVYAVDLSQGTVFPITLDKNITSFQIQNIPAGVNSFLMLLTQDGTGSKTVTWTFTGKTLKWSGGIPTITSTANATDIYSFMSVDGNTWYGSVAGKNFV